MKPDRFSEARAQEELHAERIALGLAVVCDILKQHEGGGAARPTPAPKPNQME